MPLDPLRNVSGVRELLTLLRAFRDGSVSREEIEAWTRRIWPGGQGSTFPGNGPACTVFDSIWNIRNGTDGEYTVRPQDVALYIQWLEEGDAERFARAPLVCLTLDARELADRLNRSACRFWLDGLGWQEALRFGSALTGRGYLARNPMPGVVSRTGASIYAPEGAAANECVQDVLETLALDLDDVEYLEPSLVPEELPRWELWRQDDSGNKVCIRTLSSRAKAERAVADLERGGHRQMYWVTEAPRGERKVG